MNKEKTTSKNKIHSLDDVDVKILTQLDKNARITIADISKKTGIQRDTVKFRMNKLEKNGVVAYYDVIYNPHVLGYPIYTYITLKVNPDKRDDIEKVKKYLLEHPNVIYASTLDKEWEFIITFASKDLSHFYTSLSDILEEFPKTILDFECSHLIQNYHYAPAQKIFNLDKSFLSEPISFDKNQQIRYDKPPKLDKKDKKILTAIYKNARRSITDLSEETKIQRDSIVYRLNNMEKKGVIRLFQTVINPAKLGYPYFGYIWFSLHNIEKNTEDEILDYFLKLPQALHVAKTVGRWRFMNTMYTQDKHHLNTIVKKLKEAFPDKIKEIKTLQITDEFKFDNMLGIIQ